MKTIIKQFCILGITALAATQVSCQGKKAPYVSPYASESDSVIRAKADSIARAEGRDTVGNAANKVVQHTPEENFVLDVAKNYTQELEIIRMGAENEGDKRMKALAKQMLASQKEVLHTLDSYIQRKGLTMPADTLVDISYANSYDDHQWDSAWVSLVETGHNKMIAEMETSKSQLSDPELQGMVNNTLPVFQNHLQKVEDLKPHLK